MAGECDLSLVVSWSFNVIFHVFLPLVRLLTIGMTGCLGRTCITLPLVWELCFRMLYPKLVTINTISCAGRTVISCLYHVI